MDTALALPLTAAPPSTTAPVSVQPPANDGAQSAGLVAGLGAGLGAGPGADAAGQATPFRTIVEELLAQAGGTGSANVPSGSPTIAGGTRATQSASPLTALEKNATPGSKAATPNQPEANAQWLALLFAMPVATPELPQTVAQPQASTPAKDGDLQLATLRAPESGSESKVDARPSANAGSNLPATASGDLLSFALPIAISPAPIVNAVAPQETQAPSDPSKHLAAAPNSSDLPLAGIPVSISSPPQRPTVGVPFADLLQQLSAVSQSGIETKQIAVSSESANAGAPDQPATSTQVRAPQPPPANVLTVAVEPSPTTASLPHPHASAPARSTPQAEPLAPASPPQQGTNDSLSYRGDSGPSAGSADSRVSAKAISPFSQAMTAADNSGPAPSVAQKDSAQAPVIPHPLPSTVPSTAPSSNTVNNSTSNSSTPPSTSLGALPQDPTGTKSVSDAQLSQAAGHTEMRIAMQSDKLGTIELHARVTGDEVGAAITVEKRDAHAALAVELPALQQALSDKQLKVEHVTLLQSSGHAMAGGTGGDTQQQEGRARAFSQAGTTAVPHSAAYAADFVTIAAEPEAALNVFGRLSVRA